MLYQSLKSVVKITLRLFYRKLRVNGKRNMRMEGPLLIAANHPNTMIDPMVVGSLFKQRMGFMAKSTIFLNPLVSWFLKKLHIIPVHRQSDAPEDSKMDNSAAFQKCFEYLKQKGTVIIFPEGVSFQEMRLQPVKTGAARISLEFEEQNNFEAGLRILPVSLNYSDPAKFHSELTVNIGKPIYVRDYRELYRENPRESVRQLTLEIKTRLGDLLVHTVDAEQELLFKRIKKIYKSRLAEGHNIDKNSKSNFALNKEMASGLNFILENFPDKYRALEIKVSAYFKLTRALKLHERFMIGRKKGSKGTSAMLLRFLYLLFLLPVYISGLATHYIPYKFPAAFAAFITPVFSYRAPIMMITATLFFPMFYTIEIWLFHWLFQDVLVTIAFALTMPFQGFFVLHYWNEIMWLKSLIQLRILSRNRKSVIEGLLAIREDIMETLDELTKLYLQEPAGEMATQTA
jgi:glycerol-3-phosphate O-acyltransferase / dihydroxyacetone phosphate acyltransferase